MPVTSSTNTKTTKKKYPYLGCYSSKPELIVLFTGPKTGTYVGSNLAYPVGEYKTTWSEDDYDVYSGPVVLENN